MIIDTAAAETLVPLLTDLPELALVIATDGTAAPTTVSVPWVDHESLLVSEPATTDTPVDWADTAAILYTSGTTGAPKGCLVSHHAVHRGGAIIVGPLGLCPSDIYLTVAPLYHAAAFMTLVSSLLADAALAVEEGFSASGFLQRARETGATLSLGVGFLGMALLGQPASDRDCDHKLRLCAFAPLPEDMQRDFEARFGAECLGEMYGQTECAPVAMSDIAGPRKRATHGRVLPDIEVRTMSEDGEFLADGELGELVARAKSGGAFFSGYWNQDGATAEKLKEGWLRTGDLGTIDADGYLTFFDRKADFMRRRGENVSAFQVERALLGHEAIAEAAVYGIRIPGEVDDVINAVIVLKEPLDAERLHAELSASLPYFAIPRFIEEIDVLPRNASGRVMKHLLKAREARGPVIDLAELGLMDRGRRPRA